VETMELRAAGTVDAPPKEVSLTDPQATWVTRPGINPFFAYDVNYLIDNKFGIIVDAEGTRANRIVEIAVTQTMVDRVERRFDLRPQRLAGDTVYGVARLLKWLMDRKITHTCPYGTNQAGPTASSAELISSLIGNVTYTSARRVICSPNTASSIRAVFCLTGRACMTAQDASSSHGVRRRTPARSRAISTRRCETMFVLSPTLRPSSSRAASARKSR
jgi:hypothetical protein